MLDGWYCRTMANQNATQNNDHEPNVVDDSDESQDIPVARLMPRVDYKAQYITLKKKLKFLLYVSELSLNPLEIPKHLSIIFFFAYRKMSFSKMRWDQASVAYWKLHEIVHFYWIACCNMKNPTIRNRKVTKTRNRLKMMAAASRMLESKSTFTPCFHQNTTF